MLKELFSAVTTVIESKTATWRLIVLFVVGGHVAWSCGWLPGIQGFAMAQDVQNNTSKLNAIERTVICNSIGSELGRLRSELRQAETSLLEAQQSANQQLITHLAGVLSSIRADIDDQVARRANNGCLVG